jgi:hypothetical protein
VDAAELLRKAEAIDEIRAQHRWMRERLDQLAASPEGLAYLEGEVQKQLAKLQELQAPPDVLQATEEELQIIAEMRSQQRKDDI